MNPPNPPELITVQSTLQERLLSATPMAVVLIALGISTRTFELPLLIFVFELLAILIGPRFSLDRGRQVVSAIIGSAIGYALTGVLYDPAPGALRLGWARFAAMCLLAAASRFLLLNPIAGRSVIVGLNTAAMLCAGETRTGGAFSALALVYVFVELWVSRQLDPDRVPLKSFRPRIWVVALAIVSTALAMTAGTAIGLQRAQVWMTKRIERSYLRSRIHTGFSDHMELGSLDGMQDSDTLVLRIRGGRADYLRGAVFDMYEMGRWLRSDELEQITPIQFNRIPSTSPQSQDTQPPEHRVKREISIQHVINSDRLFLPLNGNLLEINPAGVKLDPVGIIRPGDVESHPIAFLGEGQRTRAQVTEPSWNDTHLHRRVRYEITNLANQWTAGAKTPREKLIMIENHLLNFRYSKDFERVGVKDPILDFLFRNNQGHCEYFATAMTLLARASGIPARNVNGYRVTEYNDVGGYWVVRERNAHAWTEAYLDEVGWITIDATPPEAQPNEVQRTTATMSAVFDLAKVYLDNFTDWLSNLSLLQTALALLVGLAILIYIVARGAGKNPNRNAQGELFKGTEYFEKLQQSLERQGIKRAPYESIETFATKVPDKVATDLLSNYAQWRYGEIGDEKTISTEIQNYLKKH